MVYKSGFKWELEGFSPFGMCVCVCVWGGVVSILKIQDTVYHSLCHIPTSCGIFTNKFSFLLKNNLLHVFIFVWAHTLWHMWQSEEVNFQELVLFVHHTVPRFLVLKLDLQAWKQAPFPSKLHLILPACPQWLVAVVVIKVSWAVVEHICNRNNHIAHFTVNCHILESFLHSLPQKIRQQENCLWVTVLKSYSRATRLSEGRKACWKP